MKRYSVIAEVEKNQSELVLKSESFNELVDALRWLSTMFCQAYRVTDNKTGKIEASKGQFTIIDI